MSKKMFNQASLTRILQKADPEAVIGAITKSGLYQKNDLQKKIHDVIQYFPLPNFVYEIILRVVPDFIDAVERFLYELIMAILGSPPGRLLPDEFKQLAEELKPDEKSDLISYADAIDKIEELELKVSELQVTLDQEREYYQEQEEIRFNEGVRVGENRQRENIRATAAFRHKETYEKWRTLPDAGQAYTQYYRYYQGMMAEDKFFQRAFPPLKD